ncbi:MAG TPA: endo alpha-1,4 polygalactosaminidase [Bacteroidales bacterium]|nr:endo alpha-1,4 polygalactosaminidase [Bacteroidales bacterium]HPS17238.1 endo alpha-1,4 polygalactosaminidase [Bacteroidales bacterium]
MKKIFFYILIITLLISCSKEKRSDKAAIKMQDFIISISDYSKKIKPGFIIIPQNGIELAFTDCDTTEGFNATYISAIDGIGIESLFYEEGPVEDDGRLFMARKIKNSSKKVLVADYVSDNTNIANAIQLSQSEGFICFPRSSENYDYKYIPDSVINENTNDINTLQEAKNYLYLINTDNFSSKEQMINAIDATNFDVIIMDLFFNDDILTSTEISQLKTKANGGKRLLISYINIGAAENWRYYWKKKWNTIHPCWMKRKYEGYKDERWVKFWDKEWQEIIYGNDDSYIKKITDAGFDGAYLDNVEAYYFLYFKD